MTVCAPAMCDLTGYEWRKEKKKLRRIYFLADTFLSFRIHFTDDDYNNNSYSSKHHQIYVLYGEREKA